jgi:hypothetical protein
MANSRFAGLLLLIVGLSGCAYSPIYLAERPFLAMQLPQGISMSDYVEEGPFGTRFTVAEELAWLGARPGFDGKIHDLLGKEIAFWPHQASGADPGPEVWQGRQQALEELRKRCRVIEMQRDPLSGYVQ